MLKPLIGITAYARQVKVSDAITMNYDVCYSMIAKGVEQAGGLPILIPYHLQADNLRAIYQRLDGILLPGGVDIGAERYNAAPHPSMDRISPERDEMEILLAQWSVADQRPLFGICRGMQLINVALGGTLVQDIPSQWQSDLRHLVDYQSEPRHTYLHTVSIDPNSRLAQILGTEQVSVNSLHHQAVSTAADRVHIIAHAPDGIPEALEIRDHPFGLAVQWHPEDLLNTEVSQRLFESFIAAARERLQATMA